MSLQEIRKAEHGDVSVIAHMLKLLRSESPEYAGVPIDEAYVLHNLHTLIDHPDVVFLFDTGRGFMFGYLSADFHDPRLVAREELVYILPVHRSMGEARHLISTWEQACKDRGAWKSFVGVTTGIDNQGIAMMYKRFGYTETKSVYLSKEL